MRMSHKKFVIFVNVLLNLLSFFINTLVFVIFGQTTPPVYNVEDMKVPTAMFTGLKDFLSDPEDVEILKPKIHNLTYLKTIPDFSHFDFIWGLNTREEVSEEILTILRKYDGDYI